VRSAASTVVAAALSSICVEECVSSRAVRGTLRICCSTDLIDCVTAVSLDFGEQVLASSYSAQRSHDLRGHSERFATSTFNCSLLRPGGQP
jgi:hypothetical protein